MSYINVPKPTGASYTKIEVRPSYDSAVITYDSSTNVYDGIDMNSYTKIAKPVGSLGDLMWMEMSISWQNANNIWQSPYIKISKPS